MYEIYMGMGNTEHTDVGFEEFLQQNGKDICPEHGVITYMEGKVQCSVHVDEDDSDGDGDVPFL